jgi:hypothetical protein
MVCGTAHQLCLTVAGNILENAAPPHNAASNPRLQSANAQTRALELGYLMVQSGPDRSGEF